jgi:hypothetical protein
LAKPNDDAIHGLLHIVQRLSMSLLIGDTAYKASIANPNALPGIMRHHMACIISCTAQCTMYLLQHTGMLLAHDAWLTNTS